MQDANDFHCVGRRDAIEDDVHGICNGRLSAFVAAMTDVQAAKSGNKIASIACHLAMGIGDNAA